MQKSTFDIIPAHVIQNILKQQITQAYDIVKTTYLEHSIGNTVNPESYFLRFPDREDTRIIALPAAITKQKKIAGIKWIGSNPDNIAQQKERASAVIILNDYDTKYPIACLEGSVISAMRTACSAVLGAEYLLQKKKSIKRLGVIGCGVIASSILEVFMLTDWKIQNITVFDKNLTRARNFKAQLGNISTEISVSYEELMKESDLIVFTTSSIKPYVNDQRLVSHNPTILHISLRDIGIEIIEHSNNIVDDINHVLNANTSVDLLYRQTGNKDFINGTIADLIKNKCTINHSKPSIFSPMGLGVLDLALAKYVWDKASEFGMVQKIENFFKI